MTVHLRPASRAAPLLVLGDVRDAVAGQAADLVVQALERGRLEASADQAAQADLRALRAEMSPHFVYNALTVFASLARSDPDRAPTSSSTSPTTRATAWRGTAS